MEIIVKNGDEETVYKDVTDYYLAVRHVKPFMKDKDLLREFVVRSYSVGNNLRDIAKEVQQSLIEVQEKLKTWQSRQG